tara:strand:+ start:705 stop:1340 length:636 start_codon:yes stop_codon:yes gene_type:complete
MGFNNRLLIPPSTFQNPGTGMTGTTNHGGFGPYTLSNNNRTFSSGGTETYQHSGVYINSDILPNTGKYYWETVRNAQGWSSYYFSHHDFQAYTSANAFPTTGGVVAGNRIAYAEMFIPDATSGWYHRYINQTITNTVPSTPFVLWSDVWSYIFDSDSKTLSMFRNGNSFTNSVFSLNSSAAYFTFYLKSSPGGQSTINLAPTQWVYDPNNL